ncbi:MAG: NAD(P)/FAD-dependent oxidoreductase [Leptospirales bacterium]|nr:NAD(P)/FAD-dependent oxidoreductase [Leptospirales bacterium]
MNETRNKRVEVEEIDGERWDAIFIGSGIGSLAAAALLARRKNLRCLILERHYRAGGFTHAFERKGYSWDVGIHYIGGMRPGSSLYQLLNYISNGTLRWQAMPHNFDCFHYPDLDFAQPANAVEFQQRLIATFPAEQKAIERYFRDLRRATNWLSLYVMSRILPAPAARLVGWYSTLRSGLALQTTGQYLQRNFKDRRLRALLASQWGDYGLPPGESAFVIHATIASHYLEGGWYPVGGGSAILAAIEPVIAAAGGELRVNHEVLEILQNENGAACGVRVACGAGSRKTVRIFRAPVIVSDAGAVNTYGRLLNEPAPFLKQLQSLPSPKSAVTLYLGLNRDPRSLGFAGENHWIYSDFDHDSVPHSMDELLAGRPRMAFLSFPSMKDPQARKHTAEIISFADYAPFASFADSPWKNRGEKYEAMKERIGQGLLATVERQFPGFSALVDYSELSTPVTVEHFANFEKGAIYGIPVAPERYRLRWLGPRSHIKGLYLTGADCVSLGIGGALVGAVASAAAILGGPSFMNIMRDAMLSGSAPVEASEEDADQANISKPEAVGAGNKG